MVESDDYPYKLHNIYIYIYPSTKLRRKSENATYRLIYLYLKTFSSDNTLSCLSTRYWVWFIETDTRSQQAIHVKLFQFRQISLNIALVKELDLASFREPKAKSYFTARLDRAEVKSFLSICGCAFQNTVVQVSRFCTTKSALR